MLTPLHNDQAIIEATLICKYLDQVFPEHRLTPVGPVNPRVTQPTIALFRIAKPSGTLHLLKWVPQKHIWVRCDLERLAKRRALEQRNWFLHR